MYEAEGKYTDPETICKKILSRNLYGIDIDERAVQIARAALWMKAAERVFDFSGTPKNIIATNIRLPKGKDHLKAFLAKHPEDAPLQPALETIFEGLAHADELGSLLQIEEPVERELRHLRERLGGQTTLSTGGLTGQTSFAGTMTDEAWDAWRDGVIERLADHFTAEAEAADLVNAFFSRNAGKGVRLFELLSKQYDVVAANPPYMGSGSLGEKLTFYLDSQFATGKRDLYAAFILRSFQLSKQSGKVSMVTQQSWLFLKNFADLRFINSHSKQTKFRGLLYDASIELIAHLGSHAFEEIGGEVVNVVLFTISKQKPVSKQNILSFRLIGPKTPLEKDGLLKTQIKNKGVYISSQSSFTKIPLTPISYWLSDSILKSLSGKKVGDIADIVQQVITANNPRFLRYYWEINDKKNRWKGYLKGGGYCKWIGYESYLIDWDYNGLKIKQSTIEKCPYFNGNWGFRIREESFGKASLVYTLMAQGNLSVRHIPSGYLCDSVSPAIILKEPYRGLCSVLNSRLTSYILRSFTNDIKFRESYVKRVPIPENSFIEFISNLENVCLNRKQNMNSCILTENAYQISTNLNENIINTIWLHIFESLIEENITQAFHLDKKDISQILDETGTPAGWHPLITAYDALPPLPEDLSEIPGGVLNDLAEHERRCLSPDDLATLKVNLRTLYEAGPGAKVDIEDNNISDNGEEEAVAGAYIPIPAETFLEELSQKMQIHPISVYWLLKEGIEQEGWRCIPEERRITKDRFTVMILRMLSHRWPKQIEAGEPVPDWADADGIIPLTSGTGEATLLERVRMRIAEEFPGGSVAAIEREFEGVMGTSLEDWLHLDFFKHHTKQFKKRPIAWQVQSGRFTKKKQPAFACMAYYHKLDEDTLYKIKNQYVGPLRQKYETEMRGIEGIPVGSRTETQEKRYRELTDLVAELKVFGAALTAAAENGFSSKILDRIAKKEPLDAWCSIDGRRPAPADQDAFLRQERAYIPDINDGVRVNVAPLQKAGLLAADVIAKKDLEKAISDRAEWRADERRWCREGKLPKCGWW